jgi:hypothetical protein
VQEVSTAIGGEGLARSQILDAQQYASMACNKIEDATSNMLGVTVNHKMLQQDRRFMVSHLPMCSIHCRNGCSVPHNCFILSLHAGE